MFHKILCYNNNSKFHIQKFQRSKILQEILLNQDFIKIKTILLMTE